MKKLFSVLLKIGLLNLPQLTVSAGSYLYCVNPSEYGAHNWQEYKKNSWGWAKGENLESNIKLDQELNQYKGFTSRGVNGVWISGTVSYSNHFGVSGVEDSDYQAFLLVSKLFENREKAVNYCKTLQNICKNDYGDGYSHVGVSSWDIPQSTWGNIAVGFIENDATQWISCPQMNYGSNTLHYSSVADSAVFGMLVIPFFPFIAAL